MTTSEFIASVSAAWLIALGLAAADCSGASTVSTRSSTFWLTMVSAQTSTDFSGVPDKVSASGSITELLSCDCTGSSGPATAPPPIDGLVVGVSESDPPPPPPQATSKVMLLSAAAERMSLMDGLSMGSPPGVKSWEDHKPLLM